MSIARYWHSATLLPDGRVLIAGGDVPSPQTTGTNTAEIYDPATGSFNVTAPTMSGHICQQSVLLNNGQVLLVGGADGNNEVGDHSPELYNPATGTFSSAGSLPVAYASNTCQGVAATLLASGKVLLVWEESYAQIYDPATQTFTATGVPNPFGYGDGLPSSTLLMDGSVLVAGGYWDGGIFNTAYTFDEASGVFTATADMSTGHVDDTATLLPDGSVLVAGSCSAGLYPIPDSDLYDPASRMFSRAFNMVMPRCWQTATLLNGGQVLITGGFTGTPYPSTSTAELYYPNTLIPAPVLYTEGAPNQGAALHAGTSRLVTAADPALPGEAIEIYGAGLSEGAVIPPQVSIGGRASQVLFFGDAPSYSGLNQVNVVVPSGITPGGAVPVVLYYLGRPSNAVTIGVSQ